MFEYLYEWIQNIAFYMILVTALLEAFPVSSYKKYIRFFTGMILVLLLATPILKICGMEVRISEMFDSRIYDREMERIKEVTRYLEEVELDDYVEIVEERRDGSKNGVEDIHP